MGEERLRGRVPLDHDGPPPTCRSSSPNDLQVSGPTGVASTEPGLEPHWLGVRSQCPSKPPWQKVQISESLYDVITIELVDDDDMPAHVGITWPSRPSVVDPQHFRDTAAALVKLASDAQIALARIRARRYR